MSEEKLYLVENNKGEYLAGDSVFDSDITKASVYSLSKASEVAHDESDFGGHVVTLIEEPEKVVLSKEQAKIFEEANDYPYPARHILDYAHYSSGVGEKLLMNAYVNGYTVEKEKKYNVKVPHTKDVWYYKSVDVNLRTICPEDKKLRGTFTEAEIEHYGLQDCEKVECDNDD